MHFHIVGLTLGLAADADAWIAGLPFATVKHNFYRAAQEGLGSTLSWSDGPGGSALELPAAELVRRLLPVARRGLEASGPEPEQPEPSTEVARSSPIPIR